jgi:hypothetical protein
MTDRASRGLGLVAPGRCEERMLLLKKRGGENEGEGERVGLYHQFAQRIGTSGKRGVARSVSHGLCLLRLDMSDFRPPSG